MESNLKYSGVIEIQCIDKNGNIVQTYTKSNTILPLGYISLLTPNLTLRMTTLTDAEANNTITNASDVTSRSVASIPVDNWTTISNETTGNTSTWKFTIENKNTGSFDKILIVDDSFNYDGLEGVYTGFSFIKLDEPVRFRPDITIIVTYTVTVNCDISEVIVDRDIDFILTLKKNETIVSKNFGIATKTPSPEYSVVQHKPVIDDEGNIVSEYHCVIKVTQPKTISGQEIKNNVVTQDNNMMFSISDISNFSYEFTQDHVNTKFTLFKITMNIDTPWSKEQFSGARFK